MELLALRFRISLFQTDFSLAAAIVIGTAGSLASAHAHRYGHSRIGTRRDCSNRRLPNCDRCKAWAEGARNYPHLLSAQLESICGSSGTHCVKALPGKVSRHLWAAVPIDALGFLGTRLHYRVRDAAMVGWARTQWYLFKLCERSLFQRRKLFHLGIRRAAKHSVEVFNGARSRIRVQLPWPGYRIFARIVSILLEP